MSQPAADQPQLTVPVGPRDHARGAPASAPVTIVAYGDYECPFSRKAQHALLGVLADHGQHVRVAFRHFPLNRIHPRAQQAAEAAEAAAVQGAFWAMHDTLFANQRWLERGHLLGYGADLGLDVEWMAEELDERVHERRVLDDLRSGMGSGVAATPALFVNGRRRADPYEVADLTGEIGLLLRSLGDRAR